MDKKFPLLRKRKSEMRHPGRKAAGMLSFGMFRRQPLSPRRRRNRAGSKKLLLLLGVDDVQHVQAQLDLHP